MQDVKLFPHQIEAIKRCEAARSFFLFLDMGTGKSAIAAHVIDRLFKFESSPINRRALILTTKTMLRTFQREIEKWTPDLAGVVTVLTGSRDKKNIAMTRLLNTPPGEPRILLTNYDTLVTTSFQFIDKWRPMIIVADEAHKVKNSQAKRTKAYLQLADKARRIYPMTGTPAPNKELDLYTHFRALSGRGYMAFWEYRAKYFEDLNRHMPRNVHFPKWVLKPGARQEIADLIRRHGMILRAEDVLKDMPPIVQTRVFPEMFQEQAVAMRAMERDLVATVDGERSSVRIAMTKFMRCLQLSCGIFQPDKGSPRELPSGKYDALSDILEGLPEGQKAIVWTAFVPTYDRIEKVCLELGLPAVRITGEQNEAERSEAERRFQTDPEVRVMIANQAAAGLGLTLTAASYAIFFSKTANFAEDLQAMRRCWRQGSQQHQTIFRYDIISANSFDEWLERLLDKKEDLHNFLMGIKKAQGKLPERGDDRAVLLETIRALEGA